MEDVYELSVVMQREEYRKEQLDKELQEVELTIKQKEQTFEAEIDRYHAMEKRLSDLKENVKSFVDLLDYSIIALNDAMQHSSTYDIKINQLSDAASSYITKCKQLAESIELLENKLDTLASYIDHLRDVNLAANASELARVRDIRSSQLDNLNDANEQIRTTDIKIKQYRKDIALQKHSFLAAQEECQEISHQLNDRIDKIKVANEQKTQVQSTATEIEDKRRKSAAAHEQQTLSVTTNIEMFIQQISALHSDINSTALNMEEVQSKQQCLINDLNRLQSRHATLTDDIMKLNAEVSAMHNINSSMLQQIAFTVNQIAHNTKLLDSFRKADVYTARKEALEEEVQKCRESVSLLQSAIRSVQEEQIEGSSHSTMQPILDAISKALHDRQQLLSIMSSLEMQADMTKEELAKINEEITALNEQQFQQINIKNELSKQLHAASIVEKEREMELESIQKAIAEQESLATLKRDLLQEEATTSRIAQEKENEMVLVRKRKEAIQNKAEVRKTRQRVAFMEQEIEIKTRNTQESNRQTEEATLQQLQRELQEADKQFQAEVRRQEREHNLEKESLQKKIDSLQQSDRRK